MTENQGWFVAHVVAAVIVSIGVYVGWHHVTGEWVLVGPLVGTFWSGYRLAGTPS